MHARPIESPNTINLPFNQMHLHEPFWNLYRKKIFVCDRIAIIRSTKKSVWAECLSTFSTEGMRTGRRYRGRIVVAFDA